MVAVAKQRDDRVRELTRDEGWTLLEERTRLRLNVDLAEFIRRWQAGDYGDADDSPDALEIAMLLPLVGVDPWGDGQHA